MAFGEKELVFISKFLLHPGFKLICHFSFWLLVPESNYTSINLCISSSIFFWKKNIPEVGAVSSFHIKHYVQGQRTGRLLKKKYLWSRLIKIILLAESAWISMQLNWIKTWTLCFLVVNFGQTLFKSWSPHLNKEGNISNYLIYLWQTVNEILHKCLNMSSLLLHMPLEIWNITVRM